MKKGISKEVMPAVTGSMADILAEMRDTRQRGGEGWINGNNALMKDIDGKLWPPLADAFKYFDLDPKQPAHREALLMVLAVATFALHRPGKGRPKGSVSWDRDRLFELGTAHNKLLISHPEIRGNDSAAARKIKALPQYKRQHVNEGTIRDRLPAARRIFNSVEKYLRAVQEGRISKR
jgi:hypothetical protein